MKLPLIVAVTAAFVLNVLLWAFSAQPAVVVRKSELTSTRYLVKRISQVTDHGIVALPAGTRVDVVADTSPGRWLIKHAGAVLKVSDADLSVTPPMPADAPAPSADKVPPVPPPDVPSDKPVAGATRLDYDLMIARHNRALDEFNLKLKNLRLALYAEKSKSANDKARGKITGYGGGKKLKELEAQMQEAEKARAALTAAQQEEQVRMWNEIRERNKQQALEGSPEPAR